MYFRFLGHLYAGEALLFLDRIADAIQQWNPLNIKDTSFTLTPSEREDKGDVTNIHSVAGTRGMGSISTHAKFAILNN